MSTKKETWEGTIPNGEHFLSGVENVVFDLYGENEDGVLLIVDGEYYLAYLDPSDGYRSYGCLNKLKDLSSIKTRVVNVFEPQKVNVFGFHETVNNDEYYYTVNDIKGVRILNSFGELILEISTDFAEDYYPCGRFNYYPEHLPVNENKNIVN